MQLVKPRLQDGLLHLPGFSLGGPSETLREVEVWGDRLLAHCEGKAAADFFSEICGKRVQLVRKGGNVRIAGEPGRQREVRFADSFPLHLCTEESLADFNARAVSPVTMECFRPNIVLSGAAEAWAEDKWAGVDIGGVNLARSEAADRCVITTVDPVTAVKGHEPLKTLARFRRGPKGVEFGQYFLSVEGARLVAGAEAFVF